MMNYIKHEPHRVGKYLVEATVNLTTESWVCKTKREAMHLASAIRRMMGGTAYRTVIVYGADKPSTDDHDKLLANWTRNAGATRWVCNFHVDKGGTQLVSNWW